MSARLEDSDLAVRVEKEVVPVNTCSHQRCKKTAVRTDHLHYTRSSLQG